VHERTGSVTSFDEARGWGVVTATSGASYPFHCTQIADGSRTIKPGAEVRFVVMAGRMGKWEAAQVAPA
jgi:cold shock CspA family protein